MIARGTRIGAAAFVATVVVITSACSSSSPKAAPPQASATATGTAPTGQWQLLPATKPVVATVPSSGGTPLGDKTDADSPDATGSDSDDTAGIPGPNVAAPAPAVDPVLDRGPGPSTDPSAPRLGAPDTSFEGISELDNIDADHKNPPDAVGDIGRDRYVEATNDGVAVFDRGGKPLVAFRMSSIFKPLGSTNPCAEFDRGDPTVSYDERADRFLMMQFAFPENSKGEATGPGYSCIAVSGAQGPEVGWCVTAFKYPNNAFYDYPKMGVWGDTYLLSAVHYADDDQTETFALSAMQRAPLLDCSSTPSAVTKQISQKIGKPYWLALDADGTEVPSVPPTFVGFDLYTGNTLQILQVTPDFTAKTATESPLLTMTVAAYDSNLCNYQRACLPEPPTATGHAGAKLQATSDRMMNRATYRQSGSKGELVLAHTVDIDGHDHAGVRWYQLEVNDNNQWALTQQGTFAPDDGVNRWLPSININAQGDIAVAYSATGTTAPVGARATARLPNDPNNKMTLGESILVPGVDTRIADSSDGGNNRWGDYAQLNTDPTDDCRFWFTGEYIPDQGDWGTKIVSFKIPQCGGG
jgi:hypothetical protein